MISTLGDILNLLGAGVLFPLLFFPAAVYLGGDRKLLTFIFLLAMPLVTIAAILVFSELAVDLTRPSISMPALGVAGVTLLGMSFAVARDRPNKVLSVLAGFAGKVTNFFGKLTFSFVLLMALIQFAVVIMRYIFGVNSIFMQESVTYLHGSVFLLAAGYAFLTNDHVRVDIFYSTASERQKSFVDFFGVYLFLFPFCLVTLWMATGYVGSAWSVQEGSTEQSGIQGVFLLKSLIPFFATLLAMSGFVVAANSVSTLSRKAA